MRFVRAGPARGLGFTIIMAGIMTGWAAGARRQFYRKLYQGSGIAAIGLLSAAVAAQTQAPGSLIRDPQQGATPQPLPAPVPTPAPALPPIPGPSVSTTPLPTLALPVAPVLVPPRSNPTPATGIAEQELPLQTRIDGLPSPSGDPLRIDPDSDPILGIARQQSAPDAFRSAIAAAVMRNPALDEATAQIDEGEAIRSEAIARARPTVELSVTSFQIISRAFSDDPRSILERSRPRKRTDGLLRIQQPIVDFGASTNRIRASERRLDAVRASVEDTGTQIALKAVSVWYSVYGYRVLVRLVDTFADSQRSLRTSVERRVAQGVAAPADIAQVDSFIASADAQRADFKRLLVNAEAQYTAAIGTAPPADLGRAPVPSLDGITAGSLAGDADALAAVRAARSGVDAAQADVRALQSDRLPQLSAGIDAGRYGIIETARDYDVRGSLTLSLRLGGGAGSRVDQAKARVARADARLRRTRIEAERDAAIALSDVDALEEAQVALGSNYLASRRSRDVLAERFRVSRGTVVDLLSAQGNYFGVTARYLQSMIELDTARYALLARTGRLLPALGIAPAALEHR
jgi:adhesin transport system outer membrane protein